MEVDVEDRSVVGTRYHEIGKHGLYMQQYDLMTSLLFAERKVKFGI